MGHFQNGFGKGRSILDAIHTLRVVMKKNMRMIWKCTYSLFISSKRSTN